MVILMAERNTWPCRGCGKPFSSEVARNRHQDGCALFDSERPTGTDAHQDQDQPQQQPPEQPAVDQADPGPAVERPPIPEPETVEPEPPTCRCCEAKVEDTTRKGLCWGCDLAGCTPGTGKCKHHRTGDH